MVPAFAAGHWQRPFEGAHVKDDPLGRVRLAARRLVPLDLRDGSRRSGIAAGEQFGEARLERLQRLAGALPQG